MQSEENKAPLSPVHATGRSHFYNNDVSQTKNLLLPERHRPSKSSKNQDNKPHSLDDINLEIGAVFEVEKRNAEAERRKLKYSQMQPRRMFKS